jgi:hypothetical protein
VRWTNTITAVAISVLVVGCQDLRQSAQTEKQVATLYRNGSLLKDDRFHFASFNVEGEANDYNINNCQMAARLLNANVAKQWTGKGLPDVGFWCEPGPFREDGLTPQQFSAEFPTDVAGYAAP